MSNITDTLAYLINMNVPGITAQMRARANHLAGNFVATAYSEGTPMQDQARRIFDASLGVHGAAYNAETPDQKNMRAAISLLISAIAGAALENEQGRYERAAVARDTNALPTASLANMLLRTVRKAIIVGDQLARRDNGAREVFTNVFSAAPLAFLQNEKLMIFGSSRNEDGQGDRNVLGFQFNYNAGQDRYEIKPGGHEAGAYAFQTVSVPAVLWAAVPGRANYPPPPEPDLDNGSFQNIEGTELAGANVMVTTQFTGCTFCFQMTGNGYAAHISPSDKASGGTMVGEGEDRLKVISAIDSTRMARQLGGLEAPNVTGGAFANAPGGGGNFRVYGKGWGNYGFNGYPNIDHGGGVTWTVMIGFDSGHGWRLFRQTIENNEIHSAEEFT